MPVFDTPEPISATIDLGVGDLRITAGDRTDTVVEVRPADESDESDTKAAEQTRVDYANGTLTVRAPRTGMLDFSKKTRAVHVAIELPAGSRVHASAAMSDLHGTGRLGDVRFKTSAGNIRLERTEAVRLSTSAGHIQVDHVTGDAEVSTGTGTLSLGAVDGGAVAKNSNGATEIGTVAGELRARSSNGDISVGRALGRLVEVKTANGAIHLGEVAHGSTTVQTSMGEIQVGIAEGTAAWLDANTSYGRVDSTLDDSPSGPESAERTVEVNARTSMGDITVHRSVTS